VSGIVTTGRRKERGRPADRHSVPAAARQDRPEWQMSVLALQRSAGNAAVSEMLSTRLQAGLRGRSGGIPSVQRCGGAKPCDCEGGRVEIYAQRATPTEFAVRGKPPGAELETELIFFDMNSATVDGDELDKIPALAIPESQPLTLRGSASEEGAAGINVAIVEKRIKAVIKALRDEGWVGDPTPEPKPKAGSGDIDYRRERAVEVRKTGTATKQLECDLTPDGAPNDCGPDPNPFTRAVDRADKMIDEAIKGLSESPLKPATTKLLEQLFGGEATGPAVKTGLTAIKGQLVHMRKFTPPYGHRCVNNCDSGCRGGATAYNSETGSAALMTLCPSFIAEADLDERASVLIHEGSHGTPGLETEDKAYSWQRLFAPSTLTGKTRLGTAAALKNADSYATFVHALLDPTVSIGPPEADTLTGWTSPTEREAASMAVAWAQQWVVQSAAELASLYDTVKETMTTPAAGPDPWTNSYYKETMGLVASRFGLTRPPLKPTMSDRVAVAGIFDRLNDMETMIDAKLSLERVSGGPSHTNLAEARVEFADTFFTLTPLQQANRLLKRLIKAAESVPKARQKTYFDLVHDIVNHGNFGSP
jgi:hypothetical protein